MKPPFNPKRFYENIDEHIAKSGRSIIGVMDPVTPFSYTIGNHYAAKPELIVFGLDPRDAGFVLNRASDNPDLAYVKDGDPVDIGGQFAMRALWCREEAKADYSVQAGRYFGPGTNYRLLQLLVPDPQGRFPGDPDCAAPYALVPRLGRALDG